MEKELFAPGERFRGFVVERLLGKGGIGAVYLVRHEMLDTLYALKVLNPDIAVSNPTYVKRFLREAKIAARIRHPNLVSVNECGYDQERGLYYLVMDYVPGGDLRGAIAFSGKFAPEAAARIVAQVASALQAAQAYHVVHRDIKPENIILQSDGKVKLVDLGIAKAENIDDSLKTTTESVFGTPTYVSPEQATNAADVDLRADIYSLGIVFFEMVTGKTPYGGKNPAQVLAHIMCEDATPDPRDFDPTVPAPFAVLIRRMTMKDRDRRLASFDRVLEELAKLGCDMGLAVPVKGELTPTESGDSDGLGIDLEKLPEGKDTLSFDTDDPQVKEFVAKLKRRRMLRKVGFAAAVAATAAAILLVMLL